jgi:fos-like antigen
VRADGTQSGAGRGRNRCRPLRQSEEERRRQRRERNKLAAARCRKRRMDQTDTLQEEVDNWEAKKRVLQEQIQSLQNEREELQFILEAHRSVCSRGAAVKSNHLSSNIVTLGPRVVVKAEPELQQDTVVRHLTHAEAMEQQHVVTTTTARTKAKRPSSLFVSPSTNTITSLNVPIETPTNVMNQLDFNALMDGRTGLTPTNILTPIMVSMSSSGSFLQTPTVSTPSCGSQQRNTSSRITVMQELGSPSTGAPNLVSL